MRLARRTFLASTAAVLAAPALLRRARAEAAVFQLKLQHSFSAVSSVHDRFLVPWARQVEAQAGGRIRIDLFPSMQLGGAPAQLFDQVRDGMADIVFAAPSATPGRFPKTELFELPFVASRRALVSSKAIDDYARANLNDEFREVHPLGFCCADRSVVHANRPIHTVEDIKGLRLHVQTRFAGEAAHALEAVAVPMPSGQLPLAITQHVIDGCVDPWDLVPALKLDDLLKAHTDFSDYALSTTTFVLIMNKASYDRLPRDLKAVLDANSGQVAGMAGAMWDLQAAAVADAVAARGDTITTLAPEAVAHWRKATEPVIAAWLKEMKEHRIDGAKLLAGARTLIAKYESEPEPQPPQPAPPTDTKADVNAAPKADAPVAPTAPSTSAPQVANPLSAKPVPAKSVPVDKPTASIAPAAPPTPSALGKPLPPGVAPAAPAPAAPVPATPAVSHATPAASAPAAAPITSAPAAPAAMHAAPPTLPAPPTPPVAAAPPPPAPPVAATIAPPPVAKPLPTPSPPKTLDIPL
jgi:TRAP-type transport system periplasmic protein